MSPLWKLGLREALDAVRERRHGCAELMRAWLARCAEREPSVQAWIHLDAERAMAAAEAADARLAAGGAPRALEGAALAVKDIIDVAGMPTRMGSPVTADAAATASAECVARLEAAGAVIVGKSVTTEFAYYAPGKTRNPWNPAHTPGGSSSGSAAAVACGMVPGALGTQTNGSIIRPAAFCGVVGYKPTFGAVPSRGILDPWPSLDHTGVFARSVADAALLASVIADRRCGIPAEVPDIAAPRLVALRSPVWNLAEPAQRECHARAIERLRTAGAAVVERELPPAFDAAHGAMRVIMAHDAHACFGKLRGERGDALSEQLRALIDEGAAIDEARYAEARALQASLAAEFASYVAPFDAVVTPPAPGEAPATLAETGSPAFCTIWSLVGAPAVTVPVERGPRGLPLGLQIVAARDADARALAVARWCENLFRFPGLEAMR